mgnify:CR=1 FL=1
MYFDNAEGNVFRPPSEAESFILRVTIGCSHNKCTFCCMYKDVQFRMRTREEISIQIKAAAPYKQFIKRVFLADGDALILKTEYLLEILQEIKETFPNLQRVSTYASPKSILRKTDEELRQLYAAGLKLAYYGLESGSDKVLQAVNKGVTAAESIEAGQKIVRSGMKLSIMVLIGLGGVADSMEHARESARVVSAIKPNMLSALTLTFYPGSEMLAQVQAGEFEPLNPAQSMLEVAEMLSNIEWDDQHKQCIFRSNHVSNVMPLAGNIPKDLERLIQQARLAAGRLKGLKFDIRSRGF